jgi:asparagine synthase (glutamine-hydrolysing)
VVEYAAATPGRFKVRGRQTKALLRAAVRDLVPPAVLTRPKLGFPVPLEPWLRGPFRPVVDEFVLGPRALGRGLFVPAELRRLADEHRAGVGRHGDRLWLLVNLEIWQRIFLDGEDVTLPPPKPTSRGGAPR